MSEEAEYDEDEEEFEDDEEIDESDEEDVMSIDPQRIYLFEKTEEQLQSFYNEFTILSKKDPNGPLNKLKVQLLNHTIVNANSFVEGEYRPFPDFEKFDSDTLPTASDVVIILAQYMRSLNNSRKGYSYTDVNRRRWWRTTDNSKVSCQDPKVFDYRR